MIKPFGTTGFLDNRLNDVINIELFRTKFRKLDSLDENSSI